MNVIMKRNYESQPPNFKYTLMDYIYVIAEMHNLCNWRKISDIDCRVRFEECFSKYIDKKYALSVNGCNSGLDLALQILNLQPDDEVLSAAINFYGTHLSILSTPAKLILCDVDESTLKPYFKENTNENISVRTLKKSIK